MTSIFYVQNTLLFWEMNFGVRIFLWGSPSQIMNLHKIYIWCETCLFTGATSYDNRDTIGSYRCWREKIQTNGLKDSFRVKFFIIIIIIFLSEEKNDDLSCKYNPLKRTLLILITRILFFTQLPSALHSLFENPLQNWNC